MPVAFWERYAAALLVVGAALATLYAFGTYLARRRNYGRFTRSRSLAVEETVVLGPGVYVAVICADDRRLLVGVGSGAVTLVAVLDARST